MTPLSFWQKAPSYSARGECFRSTDKGHHETPNGRQDESISMMCGVLDMH
jgi:hypothetical protein